MKEFEDARSDIQTIISSFTRNMQKSVQSFDNIAHYRTRIYNGKKHHQRISEFIKRHSETNVAAGKHRCGRKHAKPVFFANEDTEIKAKELERKREREKRVKR